MGWVRSSRRDARTVWNLTSFDVFEYSRDDQLLLERRATSTRLRNCFSSWRQIAINDAVARKRPRYLLRSTRSHPKWAPMGERGRWLDCLKPSPRLGGGDLLRGALASGFRAIDAPRSIGLPIRRKVSQAQLCEAMCTGVRRIKTHFRFIVSVDKPLLASRFN